jgi:uncharacterized protein (DUF2126 family)
MGYDNRYDLSDTQHEIVRLRDDEGRSLTEIAAKLGMNKSNVARSYKAAKRKLAAKGIAPESGMNVPTAEGFRLKGYSHYDTDTQTWYKAFADT